MDAIQIGLHCTSGRKHLLYYKTGRLIFTVYDLESGASVRICALPELAEAIPSMTAQQVLSAPEDALFYFEEAHPLTQRVLDKVHRACNAPAEDIPHRTSGVQDSPEQFQKFDLPDDSPRRSIRRRPWKNSDSFGFFPNMSVLYYIFSAFAAFLAYREGDTPTVRRKTAAK